MKDIHLSYSWTREFLGWVLQVVAKRISLAVKQDEKKYKDGHASDREIE